MNFTIYSKSGCPYCVKVKQLMEMIDAPHHVFNLGDDFTKEEFYSKFGGGTTFPQVIVNDHHIGGCSDTIKYLQENNRI